jgi:hypothetical protein
VSMGPLQRGFRCCDRLTGHNQKEEEHESAQMEPGSPEWVQTASQFFHGTKNKKVVSEVIPTPP